LSLCLILVMSPSSCDCSSLSLLVLSFPFTLPRPPRSTLFPYTTLFRSTKENMLSKSPVSLKVTLKQLKKGEGKSFGECLDNDLTIASNFMKHGDFYEGVRSVLVDKDRNPDYEYKQLSDVTDELVDSFFTINESQS